MDKILCISNHSFMLGGGEHSFLDLLSRLPAGLRPVAAVPFLGELSELLEEAGIETHSVKLSTIRPWTIPGVLITVAKIARLCRIINPVLIYANGPRAAFYANISKLFHKLPVIWHCRVADKDPYLDFLLVRMSDLIITNSHATGQRFGSRWKNKIIVVHNGVDIEWLTDSSVKKPDLISESWKVIISVARVSQWKRHDIVLKAFEEVAMQEPDVHLFFIGGKDIEDPEWWDYLQGSTQQSRYSDRIHWVGKVSDVRPWYKAAHLLVLGSENEPFGRVLVEAMACGVPIVATRSGGIPEIVRHGQDGLLVSLDNEVEMAEAIAKMMKDESFRKRASASAQGRASFFSLNKHVGRMVRIFEETILQY